ncbi:MULTISPECIES: hypothetical protein [unclassified Microcoleus]
MASNLSSWAAYTLLASSLQSFTDEFFPGDAKVVRSQIKLTFHTSP